MGLPVVEWRDVMHASNDMRLGLLASIVASPFDETRKICVM